MVTLIGGGYIGMEFAGMFARLGCEVHVIARQNLPLAPRFDQEVGAAPATLAALQGISFCFGMWHYTSISSKQLIAYSLCLCILLQYWMQRDVR